MPDAPSEDGHSLRLAFVQNLVIWELPFGSLCATAVMAKRCGKNYFGARFCRVGGCLMHPGENHATDL